MPCNENIIVLYDHTKIETIAYKGKYRLRPAVASAVPDIRSKFGIIPSHLCIITKLRADPELIYLIALCCMRVLRYITLRLSLEPLAARSGLNKKKMILRYFCQKHTRTAHVGTITITLETGLVFFSNQKAQVNKLLATVLEPQHCNSFSVY